MKKTLNIILLRIHIILSYIIPKKRNYYVFLPLHDKKKLSGNIKALLFYIVQNEKNINCAVVVSNTGIIRSLNKLNVKSAVSFFDIYWDLLRAEHIITDSVEFWYLEKGYFSIIQLWHGTGFKNIALLDENVNEVLRPKLKNIYGQYSLIVANSIDDKKRKEKSFGSKNVIITGTPRNDLFFKGNVFTRIKAKYSLGSYAKIITYMPTFRDFKTYSPFTSFFWEQLQQYLVMNNYLFVIKKHPLDKYLEVPINFLNIKDITNQTADVQEILVITDLLITDYSGVVSDFVMTGRPVLIYAYDYEEYLKTCRSFYYDLEEILPKPFIKNENTLLEKIVDDTWFAKQEAVESYNNFRSRFHQYLDGNSSRRVVSEIMKLKKGS